MSLDLPALPSTWQPVQQRIAEALAAIAATGVEGEVNVLAGPLSRPDGTPWIQVCNFQGPTDSFLIVGWPSPSLAEAIPMHLNVEDDNAEFGHPMTSTRSRLTPQSAAVVACRIFMAAGLEPAALNAWISGFELGDSAPLDLGNRQTTGLESRGSRPTARLIRTARDGELVAAEWMRWFGFTDATATPVGADAGIDVDSSAAVAQVKMEGVATGRPAVQALFGVATAVGKQGVFFSLAGYTAPALQWAEHLRLPLFTFDLQGEPVPVTAEARLLMGQ